MQPYIWVVILHELSVNIEIYEMGWWNVIKQASGELYNVSKVIFIKVYIKIMLDSLYKMAF